MALAHVIDMRAPFLVSVLLATISVACSGSPSEPSPATTGELSLSCGEVVDGYTCKATFSDGTDSLRDISGFAKWSTSDTIIATVNSVGFVTVARAGEVAIRAEYRGLQAFTAVHVEVGGLRRYYRALSGWALDAQTDAKLAGVRVDILDGPNAGRTATTGSDGAYQLYDLQPGTFRMRFAKAGYVTAEPTFYLPGDRYNGFDVRLTR